MPYPAAKVPTSLPTVLMRWVLGTTPYGETEFCLTSLGPLMMGLSSSTSPDWAGSWLLTPASRMLQVLLLLLPQVEPLIFILGLSSGSGLFINRFNLYLLRIYYMPGTVQMQG